MIFCLHCFALSENVLHCDMPKQCKSANRNIKCTAVCTAFLKLKPFILLTFSFFSAKVQIEIELTDKIVFIIKKKALLQKSILALRSHIAAVQPFVNVLPAI